MSFIFIWLTMALIFLFFEIAHPGLFLFLSFCFGAFAGALVSLLGYGFQWQLIAAFGITCLAGILLYYWLKKQYGQFKKGIDSQSNVYALVGRKGFVTKTIQPGSFGFVKLNGEIWMARSLHDVAIMEGASVEVLYSKGAHVVVTTIF